MYNQLTCCDYSIGVIVLTGLAASLAVQFAVVDVLSDVVGTPACLVSVCTICNTQRIIILIMMMIIIIIIIII